MNLFLKPQNDLDIENGFDVAASTTRQDQMENNFLCNTAKQKVHCAAIQKPASQCLWKCSSAIHPCNYDKFYLYGFWFISKQQTGVIVLQRWMQLGYTMMHGSVLQSYAVVCTTMQTPASVSLCLFICLFVCLFDIMLSSSPIYRVYYFFITVYYCGIKLKGKEPLIS